MNATSYPARPEVSWLWFACLGVWTIFLAGCVESRPSPFSPVAEETARLAVSFDDAQAQVSFQIPTPTWLPPGLSLRNAHVDPPNSVAYHYRSAAGTGGALTVEVVKGLRTGYYEYPESAKVAVLIAGQTGIFVEGAWNKNHEWMAELETSALEWPANGYWFRVSQAGLDLTEETMIQLAESIE